MSTGKKWFEVANSSAESTDVFIYDSIGFYGVTDAAFVAELNAIKTPEINLHINSGGGSVFEGLAIYAAMKAHPSHIRVHIDGIAASMAGVIAMAGDEILIAENAFLMIHRVSSGVEGTAETMRAEAALLEKLEEQIVAIYAQRTGKSARSLFKAMVAETWYNAADCMAEGFCTGLIAEAKAPRNAVDLSRFARAPSAILQPAPATAQPDPAPPVDGAGSNSITMKTPAQAAPAPLAPAAVIAEPVAAAPIAEPVAALTAEALQLAIKSAVESAHAAHESVTNALRADFNTRLAAKDNELSALAQKLAAAETMSAANLGVPPIVHGAASSENSADVLAQYKALEGTAKTAFFQKHNAAIWKAYDAENCAR